jgi:redox-sensitive bicupin YhaK (pirin superfamily)
MMKNTEQLPTTTIRPAASRGHANHGWLQARFSFSFAHYFDPDHMGFHALRVMNNDTIQPGGGFPAHPHDNMEIFTYIIDGQLEHKDSMGNGSIIEAGHLQYMSAGSGVQHSEYNPSDDHETNLYQIWLTPKESNGEPRYVQVPVTTEASEKGLQLLFTPDGRDGTTAIRQDAEIYFGRLGPGENVSLPASTALPNIWIQVIRGDLSVLGNSLKTGDGLAIESAYDVIELQANTDSECLIFRLA